MHEFRPQGSSGRTADRRHEEKDLNVGAVALFGLLLAVGGGAVHLLVTRVVAAFERAAPRAEAPRDPPAPRPASSPVLESSPEADLAALREREERRLRDYAWIDRASGRLRIPLERALERLVEKGLPAREE